nr:SNF2 domain-containing protein CLASSY 4-like [Ipomoea batatas]
MDDEFGEDSGKGEKGKDKGKGKQKEKEKGKGKEKENGKGKGKEKEKDKGKEEEKEEEDSSKWLALVGVWSESRDNDTKDLAVVESENDTKDLAMVESEKDTKDLAVVESENDTKDLPVVESASSDDDVIFIGETYPLYKNRTNRVEPISVSDDKDDERKGNSQLVLVGEPNPTPNVILLKPGSASGSKVGSVDGRGPEVIPYGDVASSTSKRRVDSSVSLSSTDSSDFDDFESSSSSSSSEDDDSDDGDFSFTVPSSVLKRTDGKGKAAEAGEKRKGIVSRLRSSSTPKPLNKDERKKDEDEDVGGGEDGEQKQTTIVKKRKQRARGLNVKDILLNTVLEKESNLNERLQRPEMNAPPLPLKFRFEDEDEEPPVKEEWEVEVDNLFADLDMGRLQTENGSSAPQTVEKENAKADEANDCCHPEGHHCILDEQIGILCKHCLVVFLEMKHLYPDFAMKSTQRYERRFVDRSEHSEDAEFELGNIPVNNCARGVSGKTVWDLVPAHIKERMYQHQIDGYEFMWKNIAGDLEIENLKVLPSDKGKGCIISHAPGTGKTGLSVVFLQAFMKLFPMCRPVVIAPRSMLLTWENEFVKWDADIPFHNLNNPKLSGKENVTDVQGSNWKIFKRKSKGRELNRTLKLYSWANGSGILGITYRLFEKLAGESAEDEKVRRILLKYPGILVLDEGHTPRNDESLMWRALSKVETPLRIILSGTPFQNNFQELYNTLCLVSPEFSVPAPSSTRNFLQKGKAVRNKWTSITSSIVNDENGRRIEELKAMISPFVHVHKGHILLEKLPGLRDALVHLKLTEMQQRLLDLVSKKNFIEQDNLMTLISVHPSLAPENICKNGEKDLELDPTAGVKTNFVFELVKLCSAHGERVIVFSRLIEPLSLIKQQLLHHIKWSENEEILYMDGKIDAKYRQDRISAFNNPASVAKVLLASTASCCEGINLIGASRIVLLDVVWNPSITRQAISRAYRLGQTKVVYVYNLISSTFEARKYECQARKDRMSELVFSARENHSRTENPSAADVILEAMAENERLRGMFELIVHQPKTQQMLLADPTEGPKLADQP